MKPPVLLTYNLRGERAAKIRMVAMRFRVRLRDVERREYARPLAELVVNGPEGDWEAMPLTRRCSSWPTFPRR